MAAILQIVFLNGISCVLIQIWLKCVSKCPINKKPLLVPNKSQAIHWNNDGLLYWCTYASLGLNIGLPQGPYQKVIIFQIWKCSQEKQ